MHNRKHLAVLAALCFSFSACQVDRIEIPEEELFTREFIKSFGIISSDQDWSVLKRASVKVSVPGTTDVRILAQVDGKTQLLAHYSGVSGSRELEFDCPKQTEYVLVKTPTNFERVPLGGEFRVGAPSRAIDGTDNVPGYTINNGYFWGNKYVDAIQQKLPENDPKNMVSSEIVSDFSFISTGKPFVFYPIYWQTTGDDVLGVYWYENGEMKTKDLFSNKITVGDIDYHNIYHRPTEGIDLNVDESIPADGAVNQPTEGKITLKFNRLVEVRPSHQATISSGTLSAPVLSDDRMSVSYDYSGISAGTEVLFWVNGGSFVATDNTEGDLKTAMNQTYSFRFVTKDTRTAWTSVTYTSDKYNVTNGLSGLITMTFDSNISRGTGAVSLTEISGTSEATIGDVTVSGNTVKIPYSSASLDTSYTLVIPDGYLVGEDDNNVNLTGFDRDGKNTMKTPGYKYGEGNNLPFNITLAGNQIKDYSGSEIISSEILTGVIKYPAKNNDKDVVPKVQITGMSQVIFDLIGGDKTISFEYGIKNKANSGLSGVLDETAVSGGENSLIFIKPSQKARLTFYYVSKTSNYIYPSLWDNVQGKSVEAQAKSYKDMTEPEKWTVYTVTTDVEPNIEYVILPGGNNQMFLAGLSYQLPSEDVESSSVTYYNGLDAAGVRSRVSSSDNGIPDLGNHGKVPDFFKEGEEPGHGFSRATRGSKYAIRDGGKDEVLTHRISFTLKEGVIFGFYLRNNSGANNLTNRENNSKVVAYTNYSMSSLNQDMPNSFFNSLDPGAADAPFFASGWGTPSGGKYHGDLNGVTVPENRKYSTASTYTVRINGQEMRYFSFEDWVDYDFNDIAFMVAPESTDSEIVDNEVDTNPYIYAVEDLGATATSDIDFNDIVFAVEHVSGSDAAFVTMLAAGGTLKAHLYYKGLEIGNGFGEIVAGPHVGTDKALGHVNDWFGVDTHNVTVNVGGGVQTGFGALTTVRIPVEEDFSLVGKLEEDISRENGFFVEVEREDGRTTQITRPDHKGEAPQMIILPGTWHWPLERVAISEAYPGGINYDGTYLPSFQEWVTKGDGFGFQSIDWYKTAKDGAVMRHAWNGSEAARDYYSKQNN